MNQFLWVSILILTAAAGCKKNDTMSLATLTTTAASVITSSAAQSGGDVTGSGGSNISKRGVCYAMHSGPTVSDSVTIDGSGTGTYTSSLSNLISNATYYARAYAINADGTAYGNELSFVTAKGMATVTTTAVTNIAPLVAHSGGNVISDGGATVTSRGLCWSTSPHPTTADFKTVDSSGTGSFVDSLINLASEVVYYVRAYTVNSYGTAYGNETSFHSSSAITVTDIDGNVYGTIEVGTQTWLTSNLKVSHYQNGDLLINGSGSNFVWPVGVNTIDNGTGIYSYPMDDSAGYNSLYGKYYSPSALYDSRGLCPAGWHVPTDDEWTTMAIYEGASAADTIGHTGPNGGVYWTTGNAGTNLIVGGSSGLNLQLAGFLAVVGANSYDYNLFGKQGGYCSSTTILSSDPTLPPFVFFRIFNTNNTPGTIQRIYHNSFLMSVRCIKNRF